jgi:hypothetical protein
MFEFKFQRILIFKIKLADACLLLVSANINHRCGYFSKDTRSTVNVSFNRLGLDLGVDEHFHRGAGTRAINQVYDMTRL